MYQLQPVYNFYWYYKYKIIGINILAFHMWLVFSMPTIKFWVNKATLLCSVIILESNLNIFSSFHRV